MNTDGIQERIKIARYSKGMTRKGMYEEAGRADAERNWKHLNQSPTLGTLDDIARALEVSARWLAYGDKPTPIPVTTGYHAIPVNTLSETMEAAFEAWKAEGFGLQLFTILERLGLSDSIYILNNEDRRLRYDFIGVLNAHTLGFDFWKHSLGTYLGDEKENPELTYGCLAQYREILESKSPGRYKCEASVSYTGEGCGWGWYSLRVPCEGKLLVINEIQ